MGYVSESIAEPTRVKTLPNQLTKKLYCGSNYSAVITQFNRLLVAGEMDGGKLGIGKAHLSGNCLSFREVPKLVNVKQVACGPNHMLAICEGKSGVNETYSWGRNWCGQLGLGNFTDQY